jgi:hypothetical protein
VQPHPQAQPFHSESTQSQSMQSQSMPTSQNTPFLAHNFLSELLVDPHDIPVNYMHLPTQLPIKVHPMTADYAELFVYNCRNDFIELHDVAAFKRRFSLFLRTVVNFKFGFGKKYKTSYNDWAKNSNIVDEDETTYASWVKYMDDNTSNPWMNCMYNFVKQVTSDKCMYALSVASGTFTTSYKSKLVHLSGLSKSGFLNVIKYKELGNQAPIHWFVSQEEMQTYRSVARKTGKKTDDWDDDHNSYDSSN